MADDLPDLDVIGELSDASIAALAALLVEVWLAEEPEPREEAA